jgi:hypothetical protein
MSDAQHPPAPAIQSQGPPPERHAARLVAEMCRWLAAEEPRLRARHVELLQGMGYKLGNPKAQARFMKRLRHDPQMGPRLLAIGLTPGKRGKCALQWLTWASVTPAGERIGEGDRIPVAPWLTCLLQAIWIKDRKASFCAPIVTFSHHAMQRLAERCDARTADDLLVALRDIALWLVSNPEAAEAPTLRIPVRGGVAIVGDTPEHGLLVKTVLPA